MTLPAVGRPSVEDRRPECGRASRAHGPAGLGHLNRSFRRSRRRPVRPGADGPREFGGRCTAGLGTARCSRLILRNPLRAMREVLSRLPRFVR